MVVVVVGLLSVLRVDSPFDVGTGPLFVVYVLVCLAHLLVVVYVYVYVYV